MGTELCLRSERLYLRPLSQNDAARLQDIAGVPEVARMMSSVSVPWTDAQVADWIALSKWRGEMGFRLGICLCHGPLIGSVGVGGGGDIAYFIGRDYWGKGYVTEALQVFLRWLFLSFNISQVEAEHLDDNPASGSVLQKLGFLVVGQSACHSKARVDAEPSTFYRLTRNAYEDRK